jgi:hypothetical protein
MTGEKTMKRNAYLIATLVAFILLVSFASRPVQSESRVGQQPAAPADATKMTPAYVESVGRIAYLWGWPLVNSFNRSKAFAQAPEPGLLGGVVPVAFNRNAMLTNYVSPDQRFITCTNQDVVYGAGYLALDKGPIVFQVPDFGDRFWVYAHYDARTDEFSRIGKQYGTRPGFYMMVGPNWKGETPAGITAVEHSATALVFVAPRIFMDDTEADHSAVQAPLSQVVYYPLSEFDGKMKTKDWSKLPHFPAPKTTGETKWVNPETFFDELPMVMKQVPPMPGEEALYKWISSVLDAAAKDPTIKQTLKETAVAAERELIEPFFQWRYNGLPAGNGFNSPVNNAEWGTDYLNRTATAKSNMYDNRPTETKYIYTDNDSAGQQLNGQNNYTVTFTKVQPVWGFWSMTPLQRCPHVQSQPVRSLFTRHQEQDSQIQPGRIVNALRRRQIAWQGQGKQLAARA